MGTVTNSNNRLTDADANTGWASDGGGGAGPQNEPDLGYQLTSGSNYSVSRKVGATKGGHGYTHGSTVDMTAEANQVLMAKGVWYNSINAAAYPACTFKVGNSATVYHEYAVIDDGTQGDLDADPKRLVYIVPIDPNVGAWPDIISGTPPTLTTIDFFGIQGDFGGSAKAENVAMDAIDLVRGVGVLWITGSGSDVADFLLHDEGTVANRFGHIASLRPNFYEMYGTFWIGRTETPTATSTQWTAQDETFIFGKGFFDVGWTGWGFDLGHASTTIDFTDCSFVGLGQSGNKVYFDTIDEVATTPDEITLDPAPGWVTGTPVLYSKDGLTDAIGLTDATVYWVEEVTTTTFNIHSSRNNARTGATPIALSLGSAGESHYLQRTPDIRPDVTAVGTSGAATLLRTKLSKCRNIELTTAITLDTCPISGCELIDITTNNGGVVQNCIITGQTTEPGVALIQTNSTANIDDNSITLATGETGHAIEIDTAGAQTLSGNTLTGFWSSPNNALGAEFDTADPGGVDSTLDEITSTSHGFATGDEIFYNTNGGTDSIGLVTGQRYYAGVVSVNVISLHRSKHNALIDSNRVDLNNTGTGETHTFYSGNAAVVNTSGGSVTLTIAGGGTVPSVRNVGAASTNIVLTPVTVTLLVLDENDAALQNALTLLEAGDNSGDLPFEATVTITAVTTTATVTHASHGLLTGDKVVIRFAAEQDYNGVYSITVTGGSTYTYTMGGSPSSPATIASGKAAIQSTGVVVEGLTNASGLVTSTRAYSVNQELRGRVRMSTSTPRYKAFPPKGFFVDTVDKDLGLTKSITMLRDD